jgi:hypothetical protein
VDPEFFDYLQNLSPKDITIYALSEGSIAFPRFGYVYWNSNVAKIPRNYKITVVD